MKKHSHSLIALGLLYVGAPDAAEKRARLRTVPFVPAEEFEKQMRRNCASLDARPFMSEPDLADFKRLVRMVTWGKS